MNVPRDLRRFVFAFLASSACALGVATPLRASGEGGRVIVLGFDGADARAVQRMIDAGELPNLAELARKGTFAPLRSTNPAESAAGWAAINTGTNPLKNNVPSFVKRNLPSMVPGFAHVTTRDTPVAELDPPWVTKMLVRYGGIGLTLGLGAAVLVVSLLVLRVLLRVNLALAAFLSALVGGAGAFAVHGADRFPDEVPDVYSTNVTQPGFWDLAAEAGKRALVLDAALAFGRSSPEGARVLSGLGLPDVRGASNGNWFVYTTDEFVERPPQGTSDFDSGTGTKFRIDERDGRVSTQVYGPVNFTEIPGIRAQIAALDAKLAKVTGWKETQELRDEKKKLTDLLEEYKSEKEKHRVALDMDIVRKGDRLAISIAGQTHEVGAGEWTGWYHLPFELNRLITVHAVTRARVLSLNDPLAIYVNTLDIDPERPPFWQPISEPPEFSAELVDWLGEPFETLGWPCLTNQIKDDAIPVDVFLEDIEFTMGWRRRLTTIALERDDWDLLFSVFSSTDRVQHMMYRFHDPEHPRYDAAEAERVVDFFGEPTKLADTIPAIYRQMDAVVGEVVAAMRPEDTLLMCADHGFTSFRRQVDVNNWLIEAGYMTLTEGLTSTRGGSILSGTVDWSRTKAYAMGLGMVFVNLAGREPNGIVPKEEAHALLDEIGSRMVAEALDPGPEDAPYDQPRPSVLDYAIMEDLYQGPEPWGGPDWPCADMQVGFAEYYRMSWSGVGGGIRLRKDEDGRVVAGSPYRDNTENWSGDHASNSPDLVTGIFFSSRPVEVPPDGVSVMNVAPTVLELLGVTSPASFDLPALTFR